jgi:hypothetical protein
VPDATNAPTLAAVEGLLVPQERVRAAAFHCCAGFS